MSHVRIIAAALALASLTGCGGNPGTVLLTSPNPVGQGPISSGTGTVAKIVQGAQQACNYRPSEAVVSAIVTAQPIAAPVDVIINAICAGVAPLASGPGMQGVRQGYAHIRGRYYSLRTGHRVHFRP